MRSTIALTLLGALAFAVATSAQAKGFTRVILVSSNGRSVEVRSSEATIDGLLSRRGAVDEPRGGYVSLFFVAAGDFPANPGRYYPTGRCVALDWPSYEKTCRRIDVTLVRLLRPSETLARFRSRRTALADIRYLGAHAPFRRTPLLKSPLELALGRTGSAAARPRRCYAFAGRWRGPQSVDRPRRFFICREGVYAGHRLHPLGRGVWDWLRLNVGPPG